MKAALIQQPGPPENILFQELPEPRPAASQCLIDVRAVAVNPIDTYVRSGAVKMELPRPFIVGCDFAGAIIDVGSDVRQFKKGDRVWGSNQGLLGRQGTFAERIVVDEQWIYPTPGQVTDEQAAAIALVGITAHLGLVREAKLKSAETLFVNGGSGGVGSAVVQISKALGARVLTTAGTEEKIRACRELGADIALDYHRPDLDDAIKQAAPNGINLWWETVREPNFDRTISLLAPRGRMILMAGREARPPFPIGPFYVKGCSLHGFAMFTATPEEQRACAADINRWLSEGKLRAKIDRILPLSQAALAHRLQEENTIRKAGTLAGKIVLKPGS